MLRRCLTSLGVFFYLMFSTANIVSATVLYTVTDLGTLGGLSSLPEAINASGQVVGYSGITNGGYHAFLYSDETMIDLGSSLVDGGLYSDAHDINDSGKIVGSASASNGKSHAVIWEDGVMTDLLPGSDLSIATGINNSGDVVGISGSNLLECTAFLYSGGSKIDIGTDNAYSWASDINDSGQIVGAAGTTQSDQHAFFLSDGTMTDLGPGSSNAINATGQVVGQMNSHAFLYSGGEMFDLGTLGGSYSIAHDINASGVIVGNSSVGVRVHAFIYANDTMIDLNTLVDPVAVDGTLTYAYGINDSGQIVARCEGIEGDETHAVLLSPIPEPSTLTLLGICAIGLLGCAWRWQKHAA